MGFALIVSARFPEVRMRVSAFSSHTFLFRIGLILIGAAQILIGCGEDAAGPAVDPDAQLILLEPKGGETFRVGDSVSVRWKAQGKGLEEISSVTVSFSPDSGSTWISLKNGSIAVGDAQWGDYGWRIPAEIAARGSTHALAGKTAVLFRVQDYTNVSDPHKSAVVARPIAIRP
jgi:hypothetical protein